MLQKKDTQQLFVLQIHLQQKSPTISTKNTNDYNKKTFVCINKIGLATN